MNGETDVVELVTAARAGDQSAWDALVERYAPLILAVLRRYKLSGHDASDVSQTTWLRLIEHLDEIREPERLPGWVVTTAKHEALRILGARQRVVVMDPQGYSDLTQRPDQGAQLDENLLASERRLALLEGLAELKPAHRELLLLMLDDPPLSYEQIGERLGMPHGSIGPTRARALAELRKTPALRGFLDAQQSATRRSCAP
jgi:RNA polymerase sigma factor (sigma-70 family)